MTVTNGSPRREATIRQAKQWAKGEPVGPQHTKQAATPQG
jgi:hypothetical protein